MVKVDMATYEVSLASLTLPSCELVRNSVNNMILIAVIKKEQKIQVEM